MRRQFTGDHVVLFGVDPSDVARLTRHDDVDSGHRHQHVNMAKLGSSTNAGGVLNIRQ
jgi:hypothetical protein